MSILDAINEAEEKAEKIKEDARIKARDLVANAQSKARANSEAAVSKTREEYNKNLESLRQRVDERYSIYIEEKKEKDLEIAEEAKKNIDKASDYIVTEILK